MRRRLDRYLNRAQRLGSTKDRLDHKDGQEMYRAFGKNLREGFMEKSTLVEIVPFKASKM
jgi:hypothetical protein